MGPCRCPSSRCTRTATSTTQHRRGLRASITRLHPSPSPHTQQHHNNQHSPDRAVSNSLSIASTSFTHAHVSTDRCIHVSARTRKRARRSLQSATEPKSVTSGMPQRVVTSYLLGNGSGWVKNLCNKRKQREVRTGGNCGNEGAGIAADEWGV